MGSTNATNPSEDLLKAADPEWINMPEIPLPWIGVDSEFTISCLKANCMHCHTELGALRGEIYEAFGTIECKLNGMCPACCRITPIRMRMNPKENQVSIINDGIWKNIQMTDSWKACLVDVVRDSVCVLLGMGLATIWFMYCGAATSATFWAVDGIWTIAWLAFFVSRSYRKHFRRPT